MNSVALAFTLLVCAALPGNGQDTSIVDSSQNWVVNRGMSSSAVDSNGASSSSTASCDGFQVSLSEHTVDGVCTSHMLIEGHDIFKNVTGPCKGSPDTLVTSGGWMSVGDYLADSGEKGVLYRLTVGEEGKRCYREEFHQRGGDGGWSSREQEVGRDRCEELVAKAKELKNQEKQITQNVSSSSSNTNNGWTHQIVQLFTHPLEAIKGVFSG